MTLSDVLVARPPQGPLRGAYRGGVLMFRGVPYARAERFCHPQPVPSWTETRAALTPGPICPQSPSRLDFLFGMMTAGMPQSEHCQVLTIATPSLRGTRPVMVWLHGGAYVSGGGELAHYSPQRLAAEQGVVVVNVSYRLGALGFLQVPGGDRNCGLEDIAAALLWIKRNIHAFGGDANNITLFGHSAGGHAIGALMRRPESSLFSKAILQSAPLDIVMTPDSARRITRNFLTRLGGDPRNASIEALLNAQRNVVSESRHRMPFSPVADRREMKVARFSGVLLLTWARQDASPYIALFHPLRGPERYGSLLDTAATAWLTRSAFAAPARRQQKRFGVAGARAFTRVLSPALVGARFGACHGIELPYLLGDRASWSGAPMLGGTQWEVVEREGVQLRHDWAKVAISEVVDYQPSV